MELARAREGEKTGWISVPRKTYWPPTISTNSSTTFSKHESSTSLSCKCLICIYLNLFFINCFIAGCNIDSDDNSSIQSSPWQRDHCWKQSRPRHNISKEMAFSYTRPTRLYLTHESQKVAQSMRRRPLHKSERINFKEKENDVEVKEEIKIERSDEKNSSNDSKESIDTLDGAGREARLNKRKLNKIVKKLSDRMVSKLALNGNGANGHHHHASTAVIPTSYSLASHIANSINSQSPHQHVSPRKRILRELEKVSLEDSKRSRPKSITTNGNMTHFPPQQSSLINGSLKNEKAPPTVSRPISSYSITSLLAHNTSNNNNNNSSSNNNNNNDSITSHQGGYQQQQTSRLNSPPKSPSQLMMQTNSKRKSPNSTTPPGANVNVLQSPIQSPSPEHQAHAFHKYRPIATTPTSSSSITAPTSSSSPYNSSYHSPTSYMRGSPSPSDALSSRLRTTGNIQQSPSRFGTSSPSNYGTTPRDSSLSPNVVEKASIRTVPKKTAALRQQFNSPTMNESSNNNNKVKASPSNGKNEMKMDVDSLLRPSTLIAPPPHPSLSHPAAALSHYNPYMYLNTSPHLNYIPPPHAVPPYYHPFYNPAMMAAAAAAYRFPIPGYPPSHHPHPHPHAQMATTISPSSSSSTSALLYASEKSTNGQQRNLSSSSPPPSPYIAASPWNPIPLTNHSINDGNIIPKVKDEPSSGGS